MDEITVSTKSSVSNSAKYNVHSHLLSLLLSVHCLPGYFNLALTLFSEIQIAAMLTLHVTSHFGSQDQDSLVQGVKNLASALTFQFDYQFSGEDNFTNAVAGIIGVYFLLVFLVALGLAILYVFQRSAGRVLPKVWSFFGSVHSTAVFLFIQYFTVTLLRNLRQEGGLNDKFLSKHGAVAMISVYMTLNIIYGLITARFKINEIKGNDIMATRTPWFAVIGLLYKLALSIIFSQVTNDTVLHWLDVLIGIVFLSGRFYQYITEFPFYNYKIFKLFLLIAVFQQTELGINVFWLLISMKREVSLTIVLYSYAVFGTLLIHASFSFVYHVVRKIAIKEKVKSEKEFFIKMFAWEKIIEKRTLLNQDERNEYGVLFHHLVERHAKDCAIKDCGCKYVLFQRSLELGLFKENDKINMDLHGLNDELIKGLYVEGIKSVNKNSLIKLQFANFLIHNDEKSITNAIYLVNSAYSKDTLRQLEISTLRETALTKIENRIENILKTQKSGLQTKEFVDYNIQKSIFRKEVAENTKLYINFWTTYSKPNPLIHQLLKQNIKINRKAEKLKISWDNLSLNHSRFCRKDFIINGLYMQIIRNAPYTAENLFDRYYSLYQSELANFKEGQEKEVFNAHSNNKDIYLCVSLNQENFAHIMFASQNVRKLGYYVEELKNHSAGILMPLFFAKKHSKFLLKEITENHLYTHLNKEISVFVREKGGYIKPAKLYLTVFPYLKKGFYCLARIKLEKNNDNFLFMLPSGKIEGGTREISEKLNLEYAHGSHSNVLIHDICFFGHRLFEFTENSKVENPNSGEDMQIVTTTEPSKPSFPKTRNFTEMLEQQGDDLKASRKYSTSPKSLRPSKFQKYSGNSPKNNQASRGENMEDCGGMPGIRMKFFPYRRSIQGIQDRISSYMIFLTTVSLFTYEDQVLYIIQLRDTNNANKGSKSMIKSLRAGKTGTIGGGSPRDRRVSALNFASLAKESFDNMTDSEVATIPNESERNLEAALVSPPRGGPKIDFLTVDTPHTLLSQEKLLSTDSENPGGNNSRRAFWDRGENEDNLRGERRRIVANMQPLSEGTSQASRMNAREMNVLMSVERAIHQNKMPVSYGLVKISVIGFILLSVILFAYYQIEGNKKFDSLINNTDILEYSLAVLYYVNECTRTVTPIKLIDLGYIPKNRNGGGQFDLGLMKNFGYIVPNLTQANNQLRNSMSFFNDEQRNKFYELIPVIQSDNVTANPKFNAFDIHAQLMSSALRIYVRMPTIPKNTDPDLNFIFNNTINDLLIHDRAIFSLLQEEDKRIVDGMASFVLTLLGIMLGTGIIVIAVLIRNEVKFIKKKMLFFEYFLRIGEKDVHMTITKSTRFYEALRDSNYSEEDILYEVQSQNRSRRDKTLQTEDGLETVRSHQNLINKRKKANFRAINKDSWIGILTLIVFIMWFWFAYGIFYNEFLVQSDATQEYKSQIIQTSLFLSRFSQALQYLYIYLGGLGDIHILGNPIGIAWEKNYKELIQFNDYFTGLMNIEYNVKYEKTIKTLLNGDICALVVNTTNCYNDGKGAKLQGILGISNYEINSMGNLKNKYDVSNKSVAAMKAIYSDPSYAELERIYYSTMMPTYRRLQTVLKEVYLLAVEEFKDVIFTLNKVFLVTFLVMGVVYWNLGLRRMEREKVYFRGILKIIPVQVIMADKFLQHYMMKDSKRNFYFG